MLNIQEEIKKLEVITDQLAVKDLEREVIWTEQQKQKTVVLNLLIENDLKFAGRCYIAPKMNSAIYSDNCLAKIKKLKQQIKLLKQQDKINGTMVKEVEKTVNVKKIEVCDEKCLARA